MHDTGFGGGRNFRAVIATQCPKHQADARPHRFQRDRGIGMDRFGTAARDEMMPQRSDRLFRLPGMQLQTSHAGSAHHGDDEIL